MRFTYSKTYWGILSINKFTYEQHQNQIQLLYVRARISDIFVLVGSVSAKLVYIYPTTKNIGIGIVMIMSYFCDSSSKTKK